MPLINRTSLFVYRIIHFDNLAHILEKGICTRSHADFDPNYINIGKSEIINYRNEFEVKIKGFGNIGDYIPFYFGRQSVMLYNILTGENGVRKYSPEDIIYICSVIKDLEKSCSRFFFTDGQANNKLTAHFNNLQDLDKIDWITVNGTNFKRSEDDSDKIRKYQAEFLVHEHVPVNCIAKIVVYNSKRANEIKKLLIKSSLDIDIGVAKTIIIFIFKVLMFQIVTGDLLNAEVEALVNTVNTVGVMGKGIALQFKDAFHTNYKIYKDACKAQTFKVGHLLIVKDHNAILGEKIIINFPTKTHWRQPSKYEYIESGLIELANYIQSSQINSIAIPPLGCGNGGLDWTIIKPMMEKYLSKLDSTIYVFEPNLKVEELLQKQVVTDKAKLTPSRAMLLYSLFYYEALGEYCSLFSANKLAYFLQRMGENLKLKFEPERYGPFAMGVGHVLYALNGVYLTGLEQNQAKAFERLKLNYEKFNEVKNFVEKELRSDQKERLQNLIRIISGFESELSLEVLSSVAMILDKNPNLTLEQVTEKSKWNDRKKRLFKNEYIEIAYKHLQENIYKHELFN